MKLNVAKELKAAGWERVYATLDPSKMYPTFSKGKYYFARGTTILHSAETPELLLTKIKLLGLL